MAEMDKQLKAAQEEFAAATLWKVPSTSADSLILAGDLLVAGGSGELQALATASVKHWFRSRSREPSRERRRVASGRLLASTDSGVIYSFAAEGSPQHGRVTVKTEPNPFADCDASVSTKLQEAAAQIIQDTGITRGYGLVIGLESGQLAVELAKRSDLMIYAVDSDPDTVAAARKRIDDAGLYGTRVSVECWPYDEIPYSDDFANLIVSETVVAGGMLLLEADPVLRMLKPLGGTAVTRLHAGIPNAADGVRQWATESSIGKCLSVECERRVGQDRPRRRARGRKLDPSLRQSVEHGLRGTTRPSRVPSACSGSEPPGRATWSTGTRGRPVPLSIDGRMFVQGENQLMAYDIYNGLELWKRELPGAMRVNASHDGSNLALNSDGFFVAIGDHCLRIDPASGKTVATYKLPEADDNASRRWIYTALDGKLLYGSRSAGRLTSDRVFAVDTETGKHRWVYKGKRIASNAMAIGAGTVFPDRHRRHAPATQTGRRSPARTDRPLAGDRTPRRL